ncbi:MULTISPECIES: sensor histidine kinase [Thermotoga]|jgi:two-component system OmpR family sensor kinase|uniref:histidine kinase n=1 Tax=Thermotoga neapolitana (strain ATCC 49049 / DSM 4359 / NBRC 107923 / NS-E) TaxID=309803 RepID=B9K958_THENN|nr:MULTISPECIES: HAMP domain-containing sensor histidine kinase [Thermotoga]ACM23491.1 Sensor protein [Thermotoga neapolitana DSM 4359]AJG41394.1 Phosphate regulon sensor protein PhoR (SphS) [Thermotoga sp. RQ7]MDK2786187.1 two-component system, OmpR family, sensor kinase [Thermotoga sp.]HBF10155.1 sensor histidine kinase [Thermotoga neapolitana]
MRVIDLEDLDTIKEAVVVLNELKVVSANRSGERYGFRTGKSLISVFTCKEMDRIVSSIQEKKDFSMETDAYFFELQSKRFVSFHFLPRKSLLVVNDLTEEKKLNEAKLDFVMAVSHELFTPLSASKANLFLLKDLEKDPEKLKILDRIDRSLERMETIIRQLKLLTMIQLGLYELKVEQVHVKEVFEKSVEDLREKIESRKIRVKFSSEVESIKTDRFVFYTILKNLLSNAVKYSYPESEVEVSISEKKMTVKDQGIGIKEEEKERIFERFYRGSEAPKMAPGSGLGLSIVKHLCDMMGYRLEFKSQWLVGSEFTVWFR